MKWKIQSAYHNQSVRDHLVDVRSFSRRILKTVKTEGEILVNGKHVTVREKLKTGDILTVRLPERPSRSMAPIAMDLEIVYEDAHLLVINKPSGVAVLPNWTTPNEPALANGVLDYYLQSGFQASVHIVTRLDRGTSGLVLIAKDSYTHSLLRIENITRQYSAIVEGVLPKKEGMIDLPIGREVDSIIKRTVSPKGKRAVTHFRQSEEKGDYSLVDVRLETGRTHQIRVHFSHIGLPLMGDDLYGGSLALINRQALHCKLVSFTHPHTGERLHFYSRLPEDMSRLLD